MYSLSEIANSIGAELKGDPDIQISGIATIQTATQTDITFLDNPAYRRYLSDTEAAAVILSKDSLDKCQTNALVIANPYYAYAKISALFKPNLKKPAGIHPTAVIAETAKVASDAVIGQNVVVEAGACVESQAVIDANSYIGENVSIGAGTHLFPNVTIYHHCQVGRNCLIHSNTVIGSDGFGLAKEKGRWHSIEQLGRVIIADDVLIGASTTIDRGALSDTLIEEGVKIDNQVQVGHNVVIKAHTVIAGCSGIAGSTEIGEHCIIGGDVSVSGHLKIVDNVSITGGTNVYNRINEPGIYSSGMPLQTNKAWHRTFVHLQKLDQVVQKVKTIEKKISEEK